jgi:hypothetical protein
MSFTDLPSPGTRVAFERPGSPNGPVYGTVTRSWHTHEGVNLTADVIEWRADRGGTQIHSITEPLLRLAGKPDVPDDFPVRPLRLGDAAADLVTCGTCYRSWDDAVPTSYTPAPSGRCPFEYYH